MSPANTALAGLYRDHASELRRFAGRRVGREEAEDIVQDAYLCLLQQGTAARLDHPRAYLFRIAANLTVDFVRKTKVRLRHAGEGLEFAWSGETAPSPEAAAGGVLELLRVETSLAELPLICREAILLNRIEQLSLAEIAGRLGVSERTISRHMAKALALLRQKFGRRPET
jgi:RNA polymerase sigma factor (sigma-70 family)